MRRLLPFLAAALLLPLAGRADEVSPAVTPDLDVVASVQYAHNEIYYHTPPGITPVLANTRDIAPGQRLDLLVIVPHYARDSEGRADVSYDLVVHYPDGRTVSQSGISVAAKLKVRPATILFPQTIRAFLTGPRDPFGEYRFDFTVRDHVGGGSATKSVVVRVTDSDRPLPLPNKFEASDWISQYYLRPRPRVALPALEAMSANAALMQKGIDGLGTVLGFYGQVLTDNPWLLPWYKQWFVVGEGDERHLLGLVLAYAARADPTVIADLPTAIRTELAARQKELLPRPSTHPESGAELDDLWGHFYASGRFGPIADLVAVVGANLRYQGRFDAYKKNPDPTKPLPPDVAKAALLNSIIWSLRVNAYQHKLVHDYLLYLQLAPGTAAPVQAALAGILAWKPGKF